MSTGCRAGVLQRQPPLSVFWNANAFSILNLRATEKPSLITHDGFAWSGFSLQHMPVQLDAIGLQTANGESTIISTSAVTSALCSTISLSISNTRLTLKKIMAGIGRVDLRHAQINSIGIGQGRGQMSSKTRLGSPVAAIFSAVFWLMYSARQPADDDSSCSCSYPCRPDRTFDRGLWSIERIRRTSLLPRLPSTWLSAQGRSRRTAARRSPSQSG